MTPDEEMLRLLRLDIVARIKNRAAVLYAHALAEALQRPSKPLPASLTRFLRPTWGMGLIPDDYLP